MNSDIADFINNRAIEYEKRDRCRTYLYYNYDLIAVNGKLELMGYFSIAMKTLNISPSLNLSNSLKKKLGNLSDKDGNIVAYLIGQLGKSTKYHNKIRGEKMLQDCYDLIADIRESIGGRVILLECKPIKKLCQYYEEKGYINITEDENDNFMRYIRFIK